MHRAIVIGAGHNGLVAACYLAREGFDVSVFERRQVVGGAAVTEEIIPGFNVSSASYSLSLLRPDIYSDLELAKHGLSFYPKDPQLFVPLADGRHFFIWRDAKRTEEELMRIDAHDAQAYGEFGRFWDHAISLLRPFAEMENPPLRAELEELLPPEVWSLAVAGSVAQVVEKFFHSDEVRGAFASQGIIGTALGPRHPGTAWVMAYHYLGGELNGAHGTWAYVRGGMGSVTTALASSAGSMGVKINVGASVDHVVVENGRAIGVQLDDGSVNLANVVLSNADPTTSFLRLLPDGTLEAEFEQRVKEWKTPASVVKVNLALDELPDFTCLPGSGPQHRGTIEISPSIDYLERAWQDADGGKFSNDPFMEIFIQSTTDPTLAPEGKHVLSAFTQYAPADGSGSEDAYKNVIATIGRYAPNIADAVIASEVLGPTELEQRFGLTGGNIFHGEITPDQSFGDRFEYRTPLSGFYICGSGASPGGGVMGAAGRNAARTVIKDQLIGNQR
ncbi:MAG: NAD(P)/FAD-dependent oxidoreductase [Actinomycetota bacterium]